MLAVKTKLVVLLVLLVLLGHPETLDAVAEAAGVLVTLVEVVLAEREVYRAEAQAEAVLATQ